VALVAVTKTVDAETAAELVRLGQRDLGESRADVLVEKAERLRELALEPRWHFVGHLQRNKVRRVAAIASAIHSVDSLRLLEAIDAAAQEHARQPEVFVQVKLSTEATKTGAEPGEAIALLERAAELPHVRLAGLMTIAPLAPEPERGAASRAAFRALADLARRARMRDALGSAALRTPMGLRMSMGMSDDFETAIEEGSDLVRIGTLLFEGLFEEPAR
jgi:pyridoxal phosphate enzyme (YggS family)